MKFLNESVKCGVGRVTWSYPTLALLAGLLTGTSSPAQTLNVITGAGEESFKVVVGPTSGVVQLFGVPGIPDGTTHTGITLINIDTGAGYDKVNVETFSTVCPQIVINTGSGGSEVDVDIKPPQTTATATADFVITGSDGDDKVLIEAESLALGLDLFYNINQGAGKNETLLKVDVDPSSVLTFETVLTTGSGDDKFIAEVLSNATNVTTILDAVMGAGKDEAIVKMDQKVVAAVTTDLAIDLGDGIDKSITELKALGSTITLPGLVAGGLGDDTLELKLESSANATINLDAGAGKDKIIMSVKQALLGAPVLLGGSEDDNLSLFVEGAKTGAPFVDGGSGYDIFTGFATTILNCEEVKQ